MRAVRCFTVGCTGTHDDISFASWAMGDAGMVKVIMAYCVWTFISKLCSLIWSLSLWSFPLPLKLWDLRFHMFAHKTLISAVLVVVLLLRQMQMKLSDIWWKFLQSTWELSHVRMIWNSGIHLPVLYHTFII